MALRPVTTQNSLGSNYNQINDMIRQINNDQVTKSFKQPGGSNAVLVGKLPYDGGYGMLIYDTSGDSRVIVGIAPDGTIGLFVSKPGDDLIGAFS